MKIATHINKLHGGGAERVAATLSTKFTNHTFILVQNNNDSYDYSGELIYMDINKSPWQILSKIKQLSKIKNENNFDIVVSHLYSPNIANILSKKNEKTVTVLHGAASLYSSKVQKLIAKYVYRKADLVISMSKYYKQFAEQELGLNPNNVKCIYNPIPIQQIREKAEVPLSVEDAKLFNFPTFVNIGQHHNRKAKWHAIRAFSKVVNSFPTAQLAIIGTGPDDERTYLTSLTKELNLEKNIFFLGRKNNPFQFMRNSIGVFNSSIQEGLPMVFLEALACNTPIISTDCNSGPREILAPNTPFDRRTTEIELAEFGILTKDCDGKRYNFDDPLTPAEEQLADAAILLLKQPELSDTFKEGMNKFIETFSVENIANQYLNAFKQISI